MKKELRKSLLEIKKKKDNQLIENKIVTSRIKFIMESNSKNFSTLSHSQKIIVFENVILEIRELKEEGLISEQFDLWGMLKGLFGGTVETFAEPLIDKILSGLGFTSQGFFKKFMISYLTSKPGDLIKAFVDCKTLSSLIAKSLIEATVMSTLQKKELGGFISDVMRNTIGNSLQDIEVVSRVEDKISSKVCELFNIFGKNAKDVADKMTPQSGEVSIG
jgi:hypothetical protein